MMKTIIIIIQRRQEKFRVRSNTFFMVLLVVVVVFLCLFPSLSLAACNPQDRDSLWSFQLNVSSSSSSSKLNWSLSIDCCSWEGVECEEPDGRINRLLLPSKGLTGTISASLLNLTHLTHLNLSRNRLSGSLPTGFFTGLDQLQILDLSFNKLSGELPSGGNRLPIQEVDLSSNHFDGVILSDSFLKGSWNLSRFNVSNNTFTDRIPSFICVNSSVKVLDFSYNDFKGDIPTGFGICSFLRILRAGSNNLTGSLPADIYSLSFLQELSFQINHLTGRIDEAVTNLTKLTTLQLYYNNFSGVIPRDIGKLSEMKFLELHANNLSGNLPTSLNNCTKLVTLNLRVNSLEGDLSTFDFSTLLQLNTLDLGNNNFTGHLPSSLYSCKSLTAVRLASNQIEGEISSDILALRNLSFLSISTNNLVNITGALRILTSCENLTTLIISKNFFNEEMPGDVSMIGTDGFRKLQVLGLGGCGFTGNVPGWLVRLKSLEVIDLSQNRFTGSIPIWLGTLPNLFYIDLSDNFLFGVFPKEFSQLQALATPKAYEEVYKSYLELPVFVTPNNATNQQLYNQLSNLPPAIYVRNNSLTGSIPGEIGLLKFLHVLDFSHNKFSGSIPDQLSNLTNLEKLDLSANNLSGQIPDSLKVLHFLSSFNVAYNNLQGPIPSGTQFDTFPNSSFEGNPRLCGSNVQRPCRNSPGPSHPYGTRQNLNTKLILGLVLGICFGTGLVISILAFWILSKRRIIPGGDTEKVELDTISSNSYSGFAQEPEKDASLIVLFPNNSNELKDLTISDLLKSTDYFNQANIIGCGGFGLVYKATLANGTTLAVKKLSGDMGLMEREFRAEVEALSTAQHENLVSLQGYCVHEGCRLLIYTYMENGSLDYWLHEKADGPSQLDWPTRLKIVRGSSFGLAYMHQVCKPQIVHRDIKSSNILLNEKFEAHVADFGLSRLILPYHTHVTTELVGTLGYIPPEYGQAWVATLRGDMYSFGIVMLELLTGKRPVEVFRPKMSKELVGWVHQMRNEGKQDQIFDPLLRGKGFDEEMLQVLDIACMCVHQNPFKRPTIQHVVDWLENVGETNKNQVKV